MKDIPIGTVVRMLYIAMSYASREERIKRMLESHHPDVAITSRALLALGYLNANGHMSIGKLIMDRGPKPLGKLPWRPDDKP